MAPLENDNAVLLQSEREVLVRETEGLRLALVILVTVAAIVSAYVVLTSNVGAPSSCTDCVIAAIPTGSGTGSAGPGIAFDDLNGNLYVSSNDLDSWSVVVINGSADTVQTVIRDYGRPTALAFDPRNGDLYVANWIGNNITVIDGATNSIVGSISLPSQSLGGGPFNIVYDPVNGYMEVVETSPAELVQVNTTEGAMASEEPFYAAEDALAANPTNGDLYAPTNVSFNLQTYQLDMLNGRNGTVLSRLPMNGSPDGVAYDPANAQVFVTSFTYGFPSQYYNGSVTEVNGAGTRVVASAPVGRLPIGIAVAGATGLLYVANYYTANISIVNQTSLRTEGSIGVTSYPGPIVYDSDNRCVYTVGIEGEVDVIALPGGSCPAPPPSAVWALGVLAAGGVVGAFIAAIAYSRVRPRNGGPDTNPPDSSEEPRRFARILSSSDNAEGPGRSPPSER